MKKGTESLQAELKEVGGKVTSLEEDVAAKDALLAKYKAAQANLVAKAKGLEAEVARKEAAIEKWGVHSTELKKKLDVYEAKVRNRDRDLAAALSELGKIKRSANVEKAWAVLSVRKSTSMRYREQILKYRAQKEKMGEAIIVLRKLEQCRGNRELISEALKGDISDWSGELKDTEDDIAQYEADFAAVVVPEVEDIPFTPCSDRSPPEVQPDSAPDASTEVPEPAIPPFDEHGSMMGMADEVLNPILEVEEETH